MLALAHDVSKAMTSSLNLVMVQLAQPNAMMPGGSKIKTSAQRPCWPAGSLQIVSVHRVVCQNHPYFIAVLQLIPDAVVYDARLALNCCSWLSGV